jgi:simple sugar transport system substrate-binding protein
MRNLLLATTVIAMAAGTAMAADPPGKGITMYMQMGGNPGDGATLARQTGAAAAAKALGVDQLNEQFSGWAPETMIDQFKQAMAAKPSCIAIMGHPGNEAFMGLVKQAFDQGIEVTHGNAPLTEIQAAFGPKSPGLQFAETPLCR